MTTWLGRSLVATLALTALQMVCGVLLLRGVPSAPGALPWMVAGLAISPLIMDFYRGRPMPDPGFVVLMQLVLRGPVLIGIVLLVTRATGSGRAAGALGAGVVLSVLGGIAPLLIPNPWMPDAVRVAHLGEVGVSNFLFGLLVGWLLGAPEAARAPVSGSSPPSPPPIGPAWGKP